MSSQLLPINQINAMPVQTISGVVSGTAYSVGGRIARYFSPTDLKLDHVLLLPFVNGASNVWWQATPYLNLLGCTMLSVLMVKTYGTYLLPGLVLGVYAQVRQGPLDVPDPFYITTGGVASNDLAGKYPMGPATGFLQANGAGAVQRWLLTYGGFTLTNTGQQGAFGTDTRIVFSENTPSVLNPWGDPAGILTTATLTVSMWAA